MALLEADPSQEEVAELLLLGKWLRPGKVTVAVSPEKPTRLLVDTGEVSAVFLVGASAVQPTVEFQDVHGVRIVNVSSPSSGDVELMAIGQMFVTSTVSLRHYVPAIGPLTTP